QRDDLAQDKRELQRKLGEVTMDNELLREKIRKLEEKHPFPRLERGHRLGQFAFTKSTLSGLHAGSLRLVVIHGRVSLLAYRSDKGLESSLLGYASCLEVVVKSARPWLLVAVCLSLAGGAAWGDAVCEVLPRRVRHG
ncbi:MAG: hypothetical protein GY884_18730, partial [Proteobacteria bacterium]|nr:hypothetical protein [Pseudomonadota bacterium]